MIESLLDIIGLAGSYNAILVGVGAALLGIAAGAVGALIILRRQALVSDAIGHATLPGICIAFMVMAFAGGDGRFLPVLMLGAAASAGLGLFCIGLMTRHTRLSEDAAIGAVLSVFFGFGVVLLTLIQTLAVGRQAGLQDFMFGSAAGMLFGDALTIGISALSLTLAVIAMRRPLLMAAFDPDHARMMGISLIRADFILMALALLVTVVGLRVVGLVLIVALMVIPPVAARFWSDDGGRMILISAGIGGLSGYVGSAISASGPNLPTGAVIVLTAATIFTLSLLFGAARGVVPVALRARERSA